MVQVASFAQWRIADEATPASGDASNANKRNMPSSPEGADLQAPDLKWRHGMSAAEVKARAKEMRKAVEQRRERREAQRHAKHVASTIAGNEEHRRPVTEPCAQEAAICESDDTMATNPAFSELNVPQIPDELWLTILHLSDASALSAAACTCHNLSSLVDRHLLWQALELRLFGRRLDECTRRPGRAAGHSGDAKSNAARLACIRSEGELVSWRRAMAAPPLELPLAGMTSVSLSGEIGLSTHEDRMVRIWEAASGRRIASHQFKAKHTLTCCDAVGALAAVGNEQGVVSLFELDGDEGFGPQQLTLALDAPGDGAKGVCSVALRSATVGSPALCFIATSGGCVGMRSANRSAPAPPWQRTFSGAGETGVVAAPTGLALDTEPCHVYVARGHKAWQVDVERDAIVWEVPDMDSDTHLAALMARMGDDLTRSHGAPLLGQRIASYSPGWRLLATATPDGGVALWDVRVPRVGWHPDISAHLPTSRHGTPLLARSVHIDAGGDAWPGHLLVSSEGGGSAVYLYDIRHASACVTQMNAASDELPIDVADAPAERSALPCHTVLSDCGRLNTPRTSGAKDRSNTTGPGRVPCGCFAADRRRLVWSDGAKGGSAAIWIARDDEAVASCAARSGGGGGSARYSWRRRYAAEEGRRRTSEQEGNPAADSASSTGSTPKSRKPGKARQTKKQWSH